MLYQDKQRAVHYMDECEQEFRSLGDHKKDRRRIILWRIPVTNPAYRVDRPGILKIPFLLYADDTVEDRDDILLPIIDELMADKVREYGLHAPSTGAMQ